MRDRPVLLCLRQANGEGVTLHLAPSFPPFSPDDVHEASTSTALTTVVLTIWPAAQKAGKGPGQPPCLLQVPLQPVALSAVQARLPWSPRGSASANESSHFTQS